MWTQINELFFWISLLRWSPQQMVFSYIYSPAFASNSERQLSADVLAVGG